MKDGIYGLTLTTTDGVMGNGVCVVAGDQYVGADFTQSYQGEIHRYDETVVIHMRVQRHPHLEGVALKLPQSFNMSWSGTVYDHGFDLQARFEETGDWIRVIGVPLAPSNDAMKVMPPSYLSAAAGMSHPLMPARRPAGAGRDPAPRKPR